MTRKRRYYKRSTWSIDSVQFPRLLAELRTIGLTPEQYAFLTDSMDLAQADIDSLLERAEVSFQRIKART